MRLFVRGWQNSVLERENRENLKNRRNISGKGALDSSTRRCTNGKKAIQYQQCCHTHGVNDDARMERKLSG